MDIPPPDSGLGRLCRAALVTVDAPVRRVSALERRIRAAHQGRPHDVVRHAYLKGWDCGGRVAWAGPFPERLAQARTIAEAGVAIDLLRWALRPPGVAQGVGPGARVVWYASVLGVHDAATVISLPEVFMEGFTALKVDLLPEMPRAYSDALRTVAGAGRVAFDAQRRFGNVPEAAAAATLEPAWLEDPCPADSFDLEQAAATPYPVMVGEHCASAEQLRRWALGRNVVVHLEVERLGMSAAVQMLRWLGEHGLSCRMHGRMPLVAAVLASWYRNVVVAVEMHLAWVSERLSTLDAFQRSGLAPMRFLMESDPMLDMSPAASAPVIHTRWLGRAHSRC